MGGLCRREVFYIEDSFEVARSCESPCFLLTQVQKLDTIISMFITIINDCRDENAFGRQATYALSLFGCAATTLTLLVFVVILES